jgi:5-methylcytosine-specific restriction endonuclease McrA
MSKNTKQEYSQQLASKEWKALREKVLKRDKYQCINCKSEHNLHVHHSIYLEGFKAWEVPMLYLTTLCEVCHKFEHSLMPISSYVVKRKSKNFKEICKRYSYVKKKANEKHLTLAQKVELKKRKKKQTYV